MLPLAFAILGARVPRAPADDGTAQRPKDGTGSAPQGGWTRASALRSLAFWSVSAPFSLAITSQAGFLVHQIAFLEPAIGRYAAGIAVAITTSMAIVGRLTLGALSERINQRTASAVSLAAQAAALAVMTQTQDAATLLGACAVYGFSVGNVITFPSLIVQREFPAASFGMLIGLSTGISQFTYAFGPGLLGLVRDATGGYGASLALCIALNLIAAAICSCCGPRDAHPTDRWNSALSEDRPLARVRKHSSRIPAAQICSSARLTWAAEAADCPAPMAVSAQIIGNGGGTAESPYAWLRLATSVLIGTIGSVGLWSYVVALPAVQADFGVTRADASLAYTLNMIGFGIGAVAIGGLVDRFGIVGPLIVSTLTLTVGFLASGLAPTLMIFALANFLIGIGSSGVFAPLIADISHWFTRRRGIAVAVCSSGNYIGGAVWPPIVQHLIEADGWRQSQIVIGFVCLLTILPLLIVLRRRLDAHQEEDADGSASGARASLGLHPYALFGLLSLAGVACCVAMSMPQVHIVAYCGDLGYGVARGAEMLSLMLGFGIVSRIGSGFVADRIGGLATLLIGSVMQAAALFLYLLFDGLTPLYVISALFGLFQGGIVPMYAIVVREYFPPRQAGTLVGLVITATIFGMALGGWMSGAIFDLTGSYWQAFANGFLWNLLNIAIALFLMLRRRTRAGVHAGTATPARCRPVA